MNLELETARHRLRPISLEEKAELHALFTNPEVRRWLFDDVVIPLDEVDGFIERSDALLARGMAHWSLRLAQGGRLVGSAALQPLESGEIELLYLVTPSEWGRGHATEASTALLDHAFRTLGLGRVVAQADTPNTASVAVMQRLGMTFDRWLEHEGLPLVQYAIEREAWSKRRGSPGGDAAG